jgi:hypothetical protein
VSFDFLHGFHGTPATTLRSRRARSSTPEETCNANFSQFPEKAFQIGLGNHVSCDASSVVIKLPYWPLHRIFDFHRASPRIISPEGAVSDRPRAGRLLSLPGAPRDALAGDLSSDAGYFRFGTLDLPF